jgi:hypothetical protein
MVSVTAGFGLEGSSVSPIGWLGFTKASLRRSAVMANRRLFNRALLLSIHQGRQLPAHHDGPLRR